MEELPGRKAELRSRLLAARSALPEPAREAASAQIRRRLHRLPELATRRVVAAYAAWGAEVDLDGLLETLIDEGRVVALPRVEGSSLRLVEITAVADLRPGFRGIREPGQHGRWVRPETLDLVLAPGVGFDRHGRRLGYGGGHFDRVLARLRPGTVVVGVAFDAQLIDAIPVECHDRSVDVVVTESMTVRAARTP